MATTTIENLSKLNTVGVEAKSGDEANEAIEVVPALVEEANARAEEENGRRRGAEADRITDRRLPGRQGRPVLGHIILMVMISGEVLR